MAFASVGSLGTVNSKTAGTSLALVSLATVAVGDVIIVGYGGDNLSSSADDADYSDVSSITDAVGNTYVKCLENSNNNGGAALGATASLWMCNVTTQLLITNVITINFATLTAKAAWAWQFTKTTANTLSVAGSARAVGDAADPAAITVGSLASQEYLWVWNLAVESINTDTITQDADYTATGKDGTTGGTGHTNVYCGGGFRIFTGTTDTVDAATSAARDHAQVFAAIKEVAAGGVVGPLMDGRLVKHGLLQGRLVGA